MTTAILAFDGMDGAAASRRAAARDAHVAFITAEAAAGRLLLGLPLHDEEGRSLGSLMIIDGDAAACEAYLAAEPFAQQDVWRRLATSPFRIAPLPYAPWPATDAPAPQGRTHTITIAQDGSDDEAPARRQAVRPAHLARVRPMAADGTLLFGGAMLDATGERMVGSITVTRHVTDAEARTWMAADPYITGGVWQNVMLFGTTLRPLPYKALPDA